MAHVFEGDDTAYLEWLKDHPGSFVVNVHRQPRDAYAVLHRSSCPHIQSERLIPGAYTERGYKKLWAQTVDDARGWLQIEFKDRTADFTKPCGLCNPI